MLHLMLNTLPLDAVQMQQAYENHDWEKPSISPIKENQAQYI